MKFAVVTIALAGAAIAAPASLEARQTGYCAANAKALAYGLAEHYVYDLVRDIALSRLSVHCACMLTRDVTPSAGPCLR